MLHLRKYMKRFAGKTKRVNVDCSHYRVSNLFSLLWATREHANGKKKRRKEKEEINSFLLQPRTQAGLFFWNMKNSRTPRWRTQGSKARFAGIHIVADFWFVREPSKRELKRLLLGAAKAAKSTPLEFSLHEFSPQGLTGVLLVGESHLAIHTWPEIGYMALDIFTCGKNVRPRSALAFLKKNLKPKRVVVTELMRGAFPSGRR